MKYELKYQKCVIFITIRCPNIDSLLGPCIDGYENIFQDSIYCFKKMKSKEFTKGRTECEKDKGDIATFQNEKEKDHFMSKDYDKFRFGYLKYGKISFFRL